MYPHPAGSVSATDRAQLPAGDPPPDIPARSGSWPAVPQMSPQRLALKRPPRPHPKLRSGRSGALPISRRTVPAQTGPDTMLRSGYSRTGSGRAMASSWRFQQCREGSRSRRRRSFPPIDTAGRKSILFHRNASQGRRCPAPQMPQGKASAPGLSG